MQFYHPEDSEPPTTSEVTAGQTFLGYDDTNQEPFLKPGASGYIVVQRRRKGLYWLRFLPGLRRWARRTEVYSAKVR